MDPNATLELIREAYGTNNFGTLEKATTDLLTWISRGGFIPEVSEPQLSALLIMARAYSRTGVTHHADGETWDNLNSKLDNLAGELDEFVRRNH